MIRVIVIRTTMVCAILCILVIQSLAQVPAKMQFKFTPGEVLRYKTVTSMLINKEPVETITVVGISKQTTESVLPSGDAKITISYESVKFGEGEFPFVSNLAPITMVIAPNGTVRSASRKPSTISEQAGPSTGIYYLPDDEVKTGDTWTKEMTVPTFNAPMPVRNQLISTEMKLGEHTVAAIKQAFNLDCNVDVPPPPQSEFSQNLKFKGFYGGGTVYFSIEEGRIIRSEHTIAMKTGNLKTDDMKSGQFERLAIVKKVTFLLPDKK